MKSTFFILISILICSCSTLKKVGEKEVMLSVPHAGASGMAQVDESTYLAVYDAKNFQKGARLGLIKTYADSIKFDVVQVKDWVSEEGIPSDLESITNIPGRENEFLISESGNWQGKLGRIFHIKFMPALLEARVLGVAKIPMKNRNDIGITGDQYEGIICHASSDKEAHILLAERGGSDANPNGRVIWGEINLSTYELGFSSSGLEGKEVAAPGIWSDPSHRDITDLYLDKKGSIWASATQDLGDSGPFFSAVYELGKLSGSKVSPVIFSDNLKVYRGLPGYKIESLAGPSSTVPLSRFAFATEDEIYGGTWRPLE